MMSRRFADRVAWRSPGWLPGQDARRGLRAFWTSPRHFKSKRGAALSARISSLRRLDRRPVCLRRRALICTQTER